MSSPNDVKSVKVDNWGVFFLQKLQNFFNKTDYCDLTLQFHDNSQLKVHRLVLSACTDYFNVLEHTCETIDDALIMPNELQADVVVPIVNFMYTGTLEFELKMYGKLLRTAKEMNMTVLLRLLEAHRRTMEGVNRAQRPPSPKSVRRRNATYGVAAVASPASQQRRVLSSANAAQQQQQQRAAPAPNAKTANSSLQFRSQIGSTSLVRTVKREPSEEYLLSPTKQQQQSQQQTPPSPFEQLRKGYNNNKRPAVSSLSMPQAKKPNIEDVKEFAEQQRMRKQIAAEYGDDNEYEGVMDYDIHNDDDDDDQMAAAAAQQQQQTASTSNRQAVNMQDAATITFKQQQNDRPPTIVVKDTSNTKMDHAKIISEVLRQYPHLVKNNKNIKLKILPNVGGQAQKIIIKKDPTATTSNSTAVTTTTTVAANKRLPSNQSARSSNQPQQQQQQQQTEKSPQRAQISTIVKTEALSPPITTISKTTANVAATSSISSSSSSTAVEPQKRRIDSKTMHALIALGAENTSGPWLCLRCGVNGRPISIPSYRGFRRHLINTHKESIDAALCEHCGWRSGNQRELAFHAHLQHKLKTTQYVFPECLVCGETCQDTDALNEHMNENHADEKQQCIYCNKVFAQEMQLFAHMKTYHKKQSLADGIIDYSDEEFMEQEETLEEQQQQHITEQTTTDGKIKILSDISLPATGTIVSTSALQLSEEEYLQDGSDEPKFVNADGNEMVLTDEQRKEIMSQLNQEHEGAAGGVVMVLNEAPVLNEPLAQSTDESDKIIADDDNGIYDEFASSEHIAKKNTSASSAANLEESKESVENLEWAENLVSEHEMAAEAADHEEAQRKNDLKTNIDISKKLKELTGDWSEDEQEDEAEETEEAEEQTEATTEEPTVAADVLKDITTAAVAMDVDETAEDDELENSASKTAAAEQEVAVKADEQAEEEDDEDASMDDIDQAIHNLHAEVAEVQAKIKKNIEKTGGSVQSEEKIEAEDKIEKQADLVAKTVVQQESDDDKLPDDEEEFIQMTDSETRKTLLDALTAEATAEDDDEALEEHLKLEQENKPAAEAAPQTKAAETAIESLEAATTELKAQVDEAVPQTVAAEKQAAEETIAEAAAEESIAEDAADESTMKDENEAGAQKKDDVASCSSATTDAAVTVNSKDDDKVKSLLCEWDINEEDVNAAHNEDENFDASHDDDEDDKKIDAEQKQTAEAKKN